MVVSCRVLGFRARGLAAPRNDGSTFASIAGRVEKFGRCAISSEPVAIPPSLMRMTPPVPPGSPLVLLEDVALTLASAAGPVDILRGVSLARPVGVGEVEPLDGHGRARTAEPRADRRGRTGSGRARRGRRGTVAAQPYRHRLSVVSSAADDDRAGECRDPLGAGRRARRADGGRGGARAGGARPSPRPLSRAALGRRAAAGRDGARLCRRPGAAARRRADRQSRRRDRPDRHRLPVRGTCQARFRSLAERCDRQLHLEDGRIVGERRSAPGQLRAL